MARAPSPAAFDVKLDTRGRGARATQPIVLDADGISSTALRPAAATVRDDFRTTAPARPLPAEKASPHSAPSAGEDGAGATGMGTSARGFCSGAVNGPRRSPHPEASQHQQRIRNQNDGERQSRDECQPTPRASATSMARTTVINPLGKTQKINSWLWTAIPRHAQRLERMASQRARNKDPSVPAMSKGCSRKIPSWAIAPIITKKNVRTRNASSEWKVSRACCDSAICVTGSDSPRPGSTPGKFDNVKPNPSTAINRSRRALPSPHTGPRRWRKSAPARSAARTEHATSATTKYLPGR